MRRVSWVRIVLDDDGSVYCEVLGVGHRLPTVCRVSLGTALALAAGGVPTVVRSPARSTETLLLWVPARATAGAARRRRGRHAA